MLGYQFVIAGNHLDCDVIRRQSRQCGLGALLGRIEKGGKTDKHQFRFVAHDGMRVVHTDLFGCDAEHPEAFLTQRLELPVDGFQSSSVERTQIALPHCFIADR